MNKEFFERNRKAVIDNLEEGSLLFLYSGTVPIKSGDQNMHPFTPNRNLYYLTGIESQNVWLMISKGSTGSSETLFIDEPNEEVIKWTGKMLTKEQACERSGLALDNVRYMQDMERIVEINIARGRLGKAPDKLYFSFERQALHHAPTREEEYANYLKSRYPALQVRNAAPMMSALRVIKAPEEIECIRNANDATLSALRYMLKNARPGDYEYQWAADYEYQVARAGLANAFTTITAAGVNATMLHYVDNNCPTEEGQLILFDLGAEYGYYSADVSRTFPVNGKYTPRQKELYKIVLEAMEVAREKMRPGEPVKGPQQAVVDFYKKALRSAKLIRDDSEIIKYYFHGVSHSLGLDTHDPCERILYKPGMVVTCEPGIYVAEEGIGIRLENDILITDDVPEDITGNRLLDIDEIEQVMKR